MAIDFSNAISGAGIEMERTAQQAFGAAVDQYGSPALSSIFANNGENPFTGRGSNTTPGLDQGYVSLPGSSHEWNTTPYATDLINYQPKNRFLFRVLFETNDNQAFNALFGGAAENNAFQYVVKHIDKPTVSFDYEEINYYNFRTKVLKSIKHDALSMTMIDDIQDTFYNFFKVYLSLHSPITRTYNSSERYQEMRENGFNFSDSGTNPDSAIRGLLANGNYNILKSIRIFQYFAHGTKVNEFQFINPRILDFNFDEHSHEGGDQGNHCVIRFDYDALYMVPTRAANGVSEYAAPGTDMNISSGGGGPMSAIRNPMTDMITAGLGQQASSILQGLGNQALSGVTQGNPLLQGVAQQVTGAAGSSLRNGVFGMTSGSSPSFLTNPINAVEELF